MKKFGAIVHKDANSAFGLHFPDVPGCFSAADTTEDIMPNAVQALTLYFEDTPSIAPRGLEEIRRAVLDDLADGAFLISVPLIPSGSF